MFHIWCDSKVVAKKRYSEFDSFYRQLLARFRWFDWTSAPFPAKQLNGLWKTTLNVRHRPPPPYRLRPKIAQPKSRVHKCFGILLINHVDMASTGKTKTGAVR